MTEAIGNQITQLRFKGLGYKSIALVLDISRENVRYFCKKHGLDGKADQLSIKYENADTPEICKQCGRMITRHPWSGKKYYCSEQCRRAWLREHLEQAKHSEAATYEIR